MTDQLKLAALDGPDSTTLLLSEPTGVRASTSPFPMSIGEEIFALNLPDEPQVMHLEVRVSGVVDESRLEKAVAVALAKHPMSRARLVRQRFLTLSPLWEIGPVTTEGVVSSAHVDDEVLDAVRDDFYSVLPDLRKAPAIRVLVVHRAGGDSILFKIHHSLMDGIGELRWVNSVARAYAGRPDPMPDIDPISARDYWAMAGQHSASDGCEIPGRTMTGSVSGVARVADSDEPGFGMVHEVVTAEQCDQLDPSWYGPETTINDLLTASLHLAIERWNKSRGRETDWISIIVPVNIRPNEWNNEVAATVAIIDRNLTSLSDRLDPRSLVASVSSQMRRVRSGPSFARFYSRPAWARWLITKVVLPMILYTPRLVPGALKGPVDTIVFANMGRIDRKIQGFGREAGNLTEFWASPPITMPMGVGMDTGFLRGDLHLTLRYRRAMFDRQAAREFLGNYVRTLIELGRPAH